MDWHATRDYCLSKPFTTEEQPFGPDNNVYKVMDKLFAILDAQPPQMDEKPATINLKCEPEFAIILRQKYQAIKPGYHMNKRHWNTVTLDGSIPNDEIRDMIDDSYSLVVKGLKKSQREQIESAL